MDFDWLSFQRNNPRMVAKLLFVDPPRLSLHELPNCPLPLQFQNFIYFHSSDLCCSCTNCIPHWSPLMWLLLIVMPRKETKSSLPIPSMIDDALSCRGFELSNIIFRRIIEWRRCATGSYIVSPSIQFSRPRRFLSKCLCSWMIFRRRRVQWLVTIYWQHAKATPNVSATSRIFADRCFERTLRSLSTHFSLFAETKSSRFLL